MTEWIEIATEGYPDFRLHGFHLREEVEVRYADGTEAIVLYMGYGMFGKENREDVTHWRATK